jgi:glucosylceramidase
MIEGWITRDAGRLLQPLQPLAFTKPAPGASLPTIEVDESQTFQPIEGFGFSLTGGSAYLLARLGTGERASLLHELFAPHPESLGLSCLRLSIGASDLGRKDFSYWSLRRGTKNPDIGHFNLTAGDQEVVSILEEILEVNPEIKVIAAPWTAPPWMKTNGSYVGGSLKPENYAAYAQYFVRYIEAMRELGVNVSAVTPQNEPQNPRNEPSMVMSATEQADFIKNHLGPQLRRAELDTEILCWDHNCDGIDFPLAVLADEGARAYTSGVAWHLYNGTPDAMSYVRDRYPDKKVYFTEQWVSAREDFMDALRWHTRNVIVGALRNWSRTAMEWNLASDPEHSLHTKLGAVGALGGITIALSSVPAVVRNPGYYLMAHSAKYIRPGSTRIHSTEPERLINVACLTPDRQLVIVVMNDGTEARRFAIQHRGATATMELDAGAIATLRWSAAWV